MERIPREQLHLGTHQTITCPPIVKRVSFPSPPRSDKSVTDPTSTLSLSHSFPRSKLEFHPYSYIEFHVPTSLPQTPHTSMLDYSVNPTPMSSVTPSKRKLRPKCFLPDPLGQSHGLTGAALAAVNAPVSPPAAPPAKRSKPAPPSPPRPR